MSHARNDLQPCPFCGSDNIFVCPQNYWTGMRNTVISVEVKHWCESPDETGVRGSMIIMRAKTEDAAVAKWNSRAQTVGDEHAR